MPKISAYLGGVEENPDLDEKANLITLLNCLLANATGNRQQATIITTKVVTFKAMLESVSRRLARP